MPSDNHGYVRATVDMDVWVALNPENSERAVEAIREFGFDVPELSVDLLSLPDRVIRMGVPPFRIEVLTGISGVRFEECYADRIQDDLDGVPVSVIGLEHLKKNKRASGRTKDLVDLEHLP
jgi:hypothetical protein